MATTVFVYGTLKTGFDLAYLLAGQEFLGAAQTAPCYRMASLEDGEYPGLYQSPDAGSSIDGELWSVSSTCLAELDRVEGVAQGLYARNPIALLPPNDSVDAQAYFYLGDTTGLPDAGDRW